mmetsp:Transcript_24489/g.92524  ORF Transcript_24489/g.92524 Transcript_24489/m.92524 type:complete len:209 (-) Transcript_24489:586-1212(-)
MSASRSAAASERALAMSRCCTSLIMDIVSSAAACCARVTEVSREARLRERSGLAPTAPLAWAASSSSPSSSSYVTGSTTTLTYTSGWHSTAMRWLMLSTPSRFSRMNAVVLELSGRMACSTSGARNSLETECSAVDAASRASPPASPCGVTECAMTASDPRGKSTEQLPDVPAVESLKYGTLFAMVSVTPAAPAMPRISWKHSRRTSA